MFQNNLRVRPIPSQTFKVQPEETCVNIYNTKSLWYENPLLKNPSDSVKYAKGRQDKKHIMLLHGKLQDVVKYAEHFRTAK
jgi:hypothetical protein